MVQKTDKMVYSLKPFRYLPSDAYSSMKFVEFVVLTFKATSIQGERGHVLVHFVSCAFAVPRSQIQHGSHRAIWGHPFGGTRPLGFEEVSLLLSITSVTSNSTSHGRRNR
jgi:hypothetical protein